MFRTLSPAASNAFAECGVFFRDTKLTPHVLSLYKVGILFRERTFCDSTLKFGGFAAPHRYLIVSSNARCIDAYSQHPEWGLCLWQRDRIFKVIGLNTKNQQTQITLLEVPEEFREELTTPELTQIERGFAHQATRQFEAALQKTPLKEHQTDLWLKRLTFPLGVYDEKYFAESWHHGT